MCVCNGAHVVQTPLISVVSLTAVGVYLSVMNPPYALVLYTVYLLHHAYCYLVSSAPCLSWSEKWCA